MIILLGRLKFLFQLLWIGLLALLLGSLIFAGLSLAGPQAVTISITADKSHVQTGDMVTYRFSLVNTETQTDVIFYAPIPEGASFKAVEGAMPQTYTIGLRTTDEIKSISWIGALSGTHLITLTTVISGPGQAPGGDIAVRANLINPLSGVTIYSAMHTSDLLWPNEAYLPLIAQGNNAPVATPTPPTPAVMEIEGVEGTYVREALIYEMALHGEYSGFGNGIGIDFSNEADRYMVGQWGIYQPNLGVEKFRIERGFIDFDTTQILTMPTTVTLHLQIKNKPVGFVLPQIVHRGTWDGYLINISDMGQQWTKFETTQLARYLDTDSTSQTLDLSLSLPPSIINLGDVSHLVIRSGEEGSPPPTGEEDSCAECDRRIEYAAIKLVLAW